MTQQHDDGPVIPRAGSGLAVTPTVDGLSVWDWFAGQALAGLLAFSDDDLTQYDVWEKAAEDAAAVADAMLLARTAKADVPAVNADLLAVARGLLALETIDDRAGLMRLVRLAAHAVEEVDRGR